MSPFVQRALMTVGAIGCFVLAATLLQGSTYEMLVAGLGGQLLGWAHFDKPTEKSPTTPQEGVSQ